MQGKLRRGRLFYWVPVACSVFMASCGGGSGGGATIAAPTDFNGYVKSTLADAESGDPRDAEGTDFVFTDEPDAFDDLF